MKVAIQGKLGSFHAQAATQWFGEDVTLLECASFSEVFHQADTGSADALVTAVENTIYGSINEVYQLIDETNWPIVGEIKLPIAHQLIALPDTGLTQLRHIYSHPVALAQCRHTIERLLPNTEMVEYFDTAGAVELVATSADPTIAAIASREAAKLHNLPVLHANMQDDERNATRFLVLSKHAPRQSQSPNRASTVLVTNHEPGALVDALNVFAEHGINLVKVQSQPIVGSPWNYKFFIVADCSPAQLNTALGSIESRGHSLKILGTYRAA